MNQMNVGMNPGVGGPVGGVPMMNNGSTAPRNDGGMNMNNPEIMINNLNTYIYDYFLKRGYHDCARALVQDESIKINTDNGTKTSPGSRPGDVNGVDGDPMMTDGKDGEKIKIPDDLPRPSLPSESLQSSFLLDWFSLFWDFFWAQRKRGNSNDVRQYLQHTQNMMRIREQQHNQLMRQQPMMPGQVPLGVRRGGNGMVPPNLQKAALNNGLSQQQLAAQFQKNQQMQIMQQMQREQSEMDMNGNRPQSPASADNAPSPSKRPRLEGGAVNGQQLAPNGRGQGQMQGQQNPQQLMMPNGMQRAMNPAQYQQFPPGQAVQQKSMQGLPNGGMMNPGVMPNQADLVPMPDGQGGMYPVGPEYYNSNGQLQQVRPGMQTPGGQHGNHALQDYQMQLMLLEQQNKRRLMMARQEQDSMSRTDGQPPMPGQGLPPGTSPQGSRAGASPNPSDQMKRGTPKMPQTGLPGSPSAGDMGQNRGSPASMGLNGAQMPPDMAAAGFFPGPGGPMRPPSSNPAFTGAQMGQPIPANAGRVPSGQWQPGQPMPQHSPATQPQAGTPQDRSTMPPPQAPPAGANAGRPQPPSPQTTGNAPPTPQQSTKAAPKGKKEGAKENTRKRPNKKNAAAAAAAATPSTEANEPTPTPSTPVTPHAPNSFAKGGPNATATAPPQQTSAPAPPPMVQPTPDPSQQTFNDLSIPDASAFSLDFSTLDNPDILESFDFDTFLNTDGDGTGFGFDPNMGYSADGVETGAGDGL
ncbi:Putative Adhesion defective protein 3 [Penicillium brasilianum]|uniref:Putative Adhesion defective protein 3 n=1 Tax=Penicillium brasilianum TaxID=104259 RepID=A0A0F7TI24_PENBI|nr:Putative Adhesion defective protein 3 [Penicillium brasilianum]